MPRDFIEQKKSKVNNLLKKILGNRIASDYLIYQLNPIHGSTAHLIGLQVNPENIHIKSI